MDGVKIDIYSMTSDFGPDIFNQNGWFRGVFWKAKTHLHLEYLCGEKIFLLHIFLKLVLEIFSKLVLFVTIL